jgi:hypothetical protein
MHDEMKSVANQREIQFKLRGHIVAGSKGVQYGGVERERERERERETNTDTNRHTDCTIHVL